MKGAYALLLIVVLSLAVMQALTAIAAHSAARRAPPTEWTATAVADTWVARDYFGHSAEDPDTPHGDDPELTTGFLDGGAVTKLALLRFDPSPLPPDAAVTDARLSLYIDQSVAAPCFDPRPGPPYTLTLQVALDPWAEATLRGRDLPATARGGREITIPEVRAVGDRRWVTFDVTDIVAFWQDEYQRFGIEPSGVVLTSRPTCSALGWQVLLASRESDHPPRLDVTYETGGGTLTPVPRGTALDVTMAGQLVDASAAGVTPVPGVWTYAYAWGGRCDGSTVTGPDGRFLHTCRGADRTSLVDLYLAAPTPFVDQEHVYPLNAPGLDDGFIDMRGALQPTLAPTDVPDYQRIWTLFGTVRRAGPAGRVPLEGAEVSLTHPSAACRDPVYTDPAGAFELWCTDAFTLSRVVVNVSADGYEPWRQEFYMGALVRLDVVLTPLRTTAPTRVDTPTATPTNTPVATPGPTLGALWLPWVERPVR
jgi:hypothetical protein